MNSVLAEALFILSQIIVVLRLLPPNAEDLGPLPWPVLVLSYRLIL
jgi:hypothetical protein